MRIKELTNAPDWLLKAVVEDEDVEIDANGRVIWNSGQWLSGDFWGGDFRGGNFRGGDFRGGDFRGGNFWGGDFRGGDFRGGNFWGGDFRGGNFWGGNFWGGNFWGGDFWGGNFRGEKLKIRPLCLYGLEWRVIVTDTQMEIGCQRHTHLAWASFDADAIDEMAGDDATNFWSSNKVWLLAMCEAHAKAAAA